MSSTALTIYDKITDPASFVKAMGREIASSKMFGELTVSQGEVFALECAARRMPPLMLAEKYHVIFGKLSMKAEAMLGEFHARGGKSKIIDRTADLVAIQLELGDNKQVFSLSWEEAQGESFCYEIKKGESEDKVIEKIIAWKAGARGAKQPDLKTKYKTPRSRTQMLWARLVSDAVRAMMPEVNSGRYTPEEFDGGDDEPQAGQGEIVDAEYEVKPEAVSKPASNGNGNANGSTNGNGSHRETVTAEQHAASKQAEAATQTQTGTLASESQVANICGRMNELGMTSEARGKVLAKRGVNTVNALSADQAVEMLANLDAAIQKKRQAAFDVTSGRVASTQVAPETAAAPAQPVTPAIDPDEPCTEVQVQQVKQLLGEINQTDPGFAKGFQERYWATGREKVAELHYAEAEELIHALKGKNLESFFENSLQPHPKTKEEVPFSVE